MNILKIIPHKRLFLSKLLLFYKKFEYNQQKLNYFLHPYNASYANERIVEIAIFENILKKTRTRIY